MKSPLFKGLTALLIMLFASHLLWAEERPPEFQGNVVQAEKGPSIRASDSTEDAPPARLYGLFPADCDPICPAEPLENRTKQPDPAGEPADGDAAVLEEMRALILERAKKEAGQIGDHLRAAVLERRRVYFDLVRERLRLETEIAGLKERLEAVEESLEPCLSGEGDRDSASLRAKVREYLERVDFYMRQNRAGGLEGEKRRYLEARAAQALAGGESRLRSWARFGEVLAAYAELVRAAGSQTELDYLSREFPFRREVPVREDPPVESPAVALKTLTDEGMALREEAGRLSAVQLAGPQDNDVRKERPGAFSPAVSHGR